MTKVTLPGTDIPVSRLSFGTASLHHLPSRRLRQNLLAAAVDCGFSHFDTSPYYGFGLAEEELGHCLSARRGMITVATKVGLYPPNRARPNSASIWCRKGLGRLLPSLSRPVIDWSVARAARSLEQSLRRLRTERVDMLFLHEAAPDALDSEEFVLWLEAEQRRGRLRSWGLAGAPEPLETWVRARHPLSNVLQVRDSLERREADLVVKSGRELQITYGYLSSQPAVASSRCPAKDIITAALGRNRTGSVLVSTRRIERLAGFADACIASVL